MLTAVFGAQGTEMCTSYMTLGQLRINLSLSSHACKMKTITVSLSWGCCDDCV